MHLQENIKENTHCVHLNNKDYTKAVYTYKQNKIWHIEDKE